MTTHQVSSLPNITIILVTWNAATSISRALESVQQQSYPSHQLRTVVVDNASQDATVGIVRDRFPWVIVMPQKLNNGFASANNLAMREYPADYFVLVNPDIILESQWLSHIIAAM